MFAKRDSLIDWRSTAPAPLPDELILPQSAIMRIVKSKLPDGMMVGSDTKKAFGKACSLFILYLSTMCARATCNPTRGTRASTEVVLSHAECMPTHAYPLSSWCLQCIGRGQGEQQVDHVGE